VRAEETQDIGGRQLIAEMRPEDAGPEPFIDEEPHALLCLPRPSAGTTDQRIRAGKSKCSLNGIAT
jgi:hypothetical protein